MLNIGYISNATKYSQFPYNDFVGRNLLLFDEANFEPAALETFKLLFAGTKTNVHVKYKSNTVIQKTPIIICSNRHVFPNNEEFNSRMWKFNFKPCMFLNNLNKTLHPLSIYYLFKQYGRYP